MKIILTAILLLAAPLRAALAQQAAVLGAPGTPGEIARRDGVSFGFTRDGRLFFTEYFRGHRWITP